MTLLNNSYPTSKSVSGSEANFRTNGIGIVHFGPGAFHRAHQAVYTHDALVKHGGNWRILGVSLQSTGTADALNAQDGVYSLLERGDGSPTIKLVKSIARVEAATRTKQLILDALSDDAVRIVSMTVTEKAYGIVRQTGEVDAEHEAIRNDLSNPDNPSGIIGFLVKGMRDREATGKKPFTVLCCDNLPNNGDLIRSGVLDFTKRIGDHALATWIADNVTFPNTMVDRITPAATSALSTEASDILGCTDYIPVETEPFSQWVIEDRFVNSRPKWEDVGALFVKDVAPYEEMKLRMLNGAHSLIAYMGFLSGKQYVRDVMADDTMALLVERHMAAAAKTLSPVPEIDLSDYQKQLITRFRNPSIAHETYQIAMDGSQKMPQRIFAPAVEAMHRGVSTTCFSFATAMWIAYCSGGNETTGAYALRDPREEELLAAFKQGHHNAEKICDAFFALSDLLPNALKDADQWRKEVSDCLGLILQAGPKATLQRHMA